MEEWIVRASGESSTTYYFDACYSSADTDKHTAKLVQCGATIEATWGSSDCEFLDSLEVAIRFNVPSVKAFKDAYSKTS
jgi:hypothetical protein